MSCACPASILHCEPTTVPTITAKSDKDFVVSRLSKLFGYVFCYMSIYFAYIVYFDMFNRRKIRNETTNSYKFFLKLWGTKIFYLREHFKYLDTFNTFIHFFLAKQSNHDFEFPFHSLNDKELKKIHVLPPLQNTKDDDLFKKDCYCLPEQVANCIHSSHSKLSLLHVNIRSVAKNIDKLVDLLHQMNTFPEIIALSETKLKSKLSYNPKLSGYDFLRCNSPTNAGGVGFFVREGLQYEVKDEYNLNLAHCEDLWIEIGHEKKVVIGIVYRHPCYKFSDFQQSYENTINLLNAHNKLYIACGDFNINLHSENKQVENYVDSLKSIGCIQFIQEPTRISFNQNSSTSTATLLDHIYSNLAQHQLDPKIIISDLSDHFPILTKFSVSPPKHSKTVMFKRCLKNFDIMAFNKELEGKIGTLLSNTHQTVNCLTNQFLNDFKSLVDKHAPLRKLSRREVKLKRKPWISKFIMKDIRSKNILFRKLLRSKTDTYRSAYNKARNKLTRTIRSAKRSFYSNLFQDSYSDPKSLWKNIENVIEFKLKKPHNIKVLEDQNGSRITDSTLMCDHVNDFFVNVGRHLSDSIVTTHHMDPCYLISNNPKSLFLRPVTLSEVKALISNLDTSKSVPSYSVSIKFIKLARDTISPFLVYLFNRCFTEGCFPDAFKVSEILPVHKGGSKVKATNYRPIALLSPFSKLLEKAMHSRIDNFFTFNHLFYSNQFGFQQNSSTENAVLQIYQQLLESFERKEVTCSIFVDLKKAFDTVNHAILLSKLKSYGIRGIAFDLLRSYLSGRTQYSSFNNCKSKTREITCGVPQGSTLGPLLFLVYVNDMNLASRLRLNLFADDAYFSYSNVSPLILENTINAEMKKILAWMNTNKLTINLSKTNYMIFTNKRSQRKFSITVGDQEILRCRKAKYLGVIIDDKLTWQHHLQSLKNKLASGCWALYRLKDYVNKKTLRMVYFGLIYSNLQYCISCWGSASQCHLEPLNILNRRAIRTIFNADRRAHTTPLFHSLNTLKIDDIYKLQIGKIMHQISTNTYRGNYNITPITHIHNHQTRFSENLNYYMSSSTLKSTSRALSIAGPKLWAQIPSDLKSLPFHRFKFAFRKSLIEQYSP